MFKLLSDRLHSKQHRKWSKIGLLSQSELERAVRKERSRCDRYSLCFSLIAMELRCDGKAREGQTIRLVQLMKKRLRITDELGLLGDGRLGVLLPHTDRDGALVVLNNILQIAGREKIFFSADINTYPSEWSGLGRLPDGDEDQDQDQDQDQDLAGVASTVSVESMSKLATVGNETISVIQARYPMWKRVMDVLGAAVGMVLVSPILALASIAIKLTSPGPVIYTQLRTGFQGQHFRIYKLRTMVVDAEGKQSELMERNERDGPAFKVQNDPRITPVGRVLRTLAVDELPQLWNVLKGDMALVGPRPLPCHEAEGCEPWQWHRHESKPGLTCTWQISKSRKISFDDWMRMDLRYGVGPGIIGDLRLIFSTVVAMVLGRVEH